MHRRTFLHSTFLQSAIALAAGPRFDLAAIERPRVLKAANAYLAAEPTTVTAAACPRSAGANHDFFSEGDYFPLELARTKPYGYSLFNLDAMATLVQTLTTKRDDLWKWKLPDGRGMAKAMEYMVPFIADKSKWPFQPDVMYFDDWPVRQPSLVFAGLALNNPEYLAVWRKLNPDPGVEEVIRNYPIRQPLLWV